MQWSSFWQTIGDPLPPCPRRAMRGRRVEPLVNFAPRLSEYGSPTQARGPNDSAPDLLKLTRTVHGPRPTDMPSAYPIPLSCGIAKTREKGRQASVLSQEIAPGKFYTEVSEKVGFVWALWPCIFPLLVL